MNPIRNDLMNINITRRCAEMQLLAHLNSNSTVTIVGSVLIWPPISQSDIKQGRN